MNWFQALVLYVKANVKGKALIFGHGLPPSHRHFLNPRLMSFPNHQSCQFPPETNRVCFMEMSPARAAITGTAAIMAQCRMGQIQVRREPAIKLGTREQSHLPSTQPSGLNYEASVGLAAERLIIIQLSSKSAPN